METEQVLELAAIIREVNGSNKKGAAQLAEDILNHPNFKKELLYHIFKEFIDENVPFEEVSPKAEFDCEPCLRSRDGTMRHDHSAHLRKQFRQEEITFKWNERQLIRSNILSKLEEKFL